LGALWVVGGASAASYSNSMGYTVAYKHKVYLHNIVKHLKVKFARTNQKRA